MELPRGLSSLGAAVLVWAIVLVPVSAAAQNQQSRDSSVRGELESDFKYLANNLEADAEDLVTAPIHAGGFGEVLRDERFYLVLGGAGGAWGGSFALDQTMRSHLRGMSSGHANLLEDVSIGSVSAAAGMLYLYGLYADDARAREYMLTAGASAGIASLIVIGLKAGFGRLRPHQNRHDHDAFFHGGSSFVSGEVTPMFSIAAGISEYYDNRWYIAAPIYGLALLDGFGRMGHDAHWFSDVIGAALLGVGMTELLLYTHRYHAEHPWRLRIFPAAAPASAFPSRSASAPIGVTVAIDF